MFHVSWLNDNYYSALVTFLTDSYKMGKRSSGCIRKSSYLCKGKPLFIGEYNSKYFSWNESCDLYHFSTVIKWVWLPTASTFEGLNQAFHWKRTKKIESGLLLKADWVMALDQNLWYYMLKLMSLILSIKIILNIFDLKSFWVMAFFFYPNMNIVKYSI